MSKKHQYTLASKKKAETCLYSDIVLVYARVEMIDTCRVKNKIENVDIDPVYTKKKKGKLVQFPLNSNVRYRSGLNDRHKISVKMHAYVSFTI